MLICPFCCVWVNVNSCDSGIFPMTSNVVVKQSSFKAQVHRVENRTYRKDLFHE